MAFVSTLQPLPADVLIETNGSATYVFENIGYDDAESGTAYFLSVILDVMAGGGHELTFAIVETSDAGDYVLWSGEDTRQILKGQTRADVLERLLATVEHLVRVVHPESVSMYTVDRGLPEKALIKYRLICDRIEALGFELQPPENFHGQWGWKLTSRESP